MPNPGGAIKGGTFATGRVVRRVLPSALVVPSTAIRQRPNTGAPFVYLIAGDAVAESDVTLGANDDAQELVEVLSGVNEGDQVIVGNVGMLGKGMRVQVLGTEGPGGRRGPGGGVRPGGFERPGSGSGSGSGSNGTRASQGDGNARRPEAPASPNPNR